MFFPEQALRKEIYFRTSRSAGAGGQHVNKTETRVEAILAISESKVLTDHQKQRIKSRLKNRINATGLLVVACAETRSQNRNKQIATDRLISLITLGLEKKKIRKKTGIPKSARRNRLESKRKQAEKKARRRFTPE